MERIIARAVVDQAFHQALPVDLEGALRPVKVGLAQAGGGRERDFAANPVSR